MVVSIFRKFLDAQTARVLALEFHRSVDFDWAMSAARKQLPPKQDFRGPPRLEQVKKLARVLRKQRNSSKPKKDQNHTDLNNYRSAQQTFDKIGGVSVFGVPKINSLGEMSSSYLEAQQLPIDTLAKTPTWFQQDAFRDIKSFSVAPYPEDLEEMHERFIEGDQPSHIGALSGFFIEDTGDMYVTPDRRSMLHELSHAVIKNNFQQMSKYEHIYDRERGTAPSFYGANAGWEEGLSEAFAFFFSTSESNKYLKSRTPQTWQFIQHMVEGQGR